jgi:hypothetical protein
MKYSYAVCILLVLLVCSAGCTQFYSQFDPVKTAAPTKAPTKTPTAKPPVNLTPNTTPIINKAAVVVVETPLIVKTPTIPKPTVTPTPTGYWLPVPDVTAAIEPTPTPTISNVAASWLWFQNKDFKIEYPSGWEVIETIAPQPNWMVYGENKLRGDSRIVKFEAGDGKTNMTVRTTDLFLPDYINQDTTIIWVKNQIPPGTGGVVVNYEARVTDKKTPYVSFDIIVPEYSAYPPYAYAERDLVSWNHAYSVRFNTAGNLTEFKDIKTRMFDSLRTQERIKEVGTDFS